MYLPFYFRFGEAKSQGSVERTPDGQKGSGQPTSPPARDSERRGRGGRGAGSREPRPGPGQPSGLHEKAWEDVRRPGALPSGSPQSPRASPVPPRGSPVFHNALLATSRPQPSVTRSPTPAVKGDLPRHREIKATLKLYKALKPPTATSVHRAPTL